MLEDPFVYGLGTPLLKALSVRVQVGFDMVVALHYGVRMFAEMGRLLKKSLKR